jgi:hypothetical protein
MDKGESCGQETIYTPHGKRSGWRRVGEEQERVKRTPTKPREALSCAKCLTTDASEYRWVGKALCCRDCAEEALIKKKAVTRAPVDSESETDFSEDESPASHSVCVNCKTKSSPCWRKTAKPGVVLCNACGLAEKRGNKRNGEANKA